MGHVVVGPHCADAAGQLGLGVVATVAVVVVVVDVGVVAAVVVDVVG